MNIKVFLFGMSAGLTIAFLVVAFFPMLRWVEYFFLRRRAKKLTAELKWFGSQLVICTRNNVMAVCTLRAFNSALEAWKKKISENPQTEWGAPIIHVEPTFTFSEEDMPMCTGNRKDLAGIVVDLIYDLLKGKYSKSFIQKGLEDLGKIVSRRDNRLFVPFAGDKWLPEWETHRYTDVQLARLRLHKEVLDQIPWINTK